MFEELLHIAALSHLSTSIKRELSSIIVFESHAQAGTIRKCNDLEKKLKNFLNSIGIGNYMAHTMRAKFS